MIDHCPSTGKVSFATAAKAYATLGRASSRRRKYKPNGHAYRCKHCHQWHATSEAKRA